MLAIQPPLPSGWRWRLFGACNERLRHRADSCGGRRLPALTVYCHTLGLAFLVFWGLYVLLKSERSARSSWAVTFAVIGLLLVPAAYRLLSFPPVASANPEYSFNPLHVVYGIWSFSTGYSLGPSLADLHALNRKRLVIHYLWLLVPVLAIVTQLAILGIRRVGKSDRTARRILVLWFLVPMTFAVLGSIVAVHPFNVRYAMLAYPAFIAAVVAGIDVLHARWLRVSTWVWLVTLSVGSLYGYFFVGRYFRENNRAAAAFLGAHARGGDLVIASAPYTAPNLAYYAKEPRPTIAPYPPDERFIDSSRLDADFASLLEGRDHFWLFLSRTYHSDPAGHLTHYCDEHFRRQLVFDGDGVELILYRRPA